MGAHARLGFGTRGARIQDARHGSAGKKGDVKKNEAHMAKSDIRARAHSAGFFEVQKTRFLRLENFQIFMCMHV